MREREREKGLLVVGIDLRGRGERKVRLVKVRLTRIGGQSPRLGRLGPSAAARQTISLPL